MKKSTTIANYIYYVIVFN